MPRAAKQNGLGKALKNKLEKKHRPTGNQAPIFYQETEENAADKLKQKMQSVIEQNSLS